MLSRYLAEYAGGLSNTVLPAITGTHTVGGVLSVSNGSWTPVATSYTYKWKRNGSVISGATSSTYTLVSADAGTAITCTVTASSTTGDSGVATSSSVGILPYDSVAPTISGTNTVGSTLTLTSNGTWAGASSFAFQWQRGGTNIAGATASTYVLQSADVGYSITCLVTATNTAGSSSVSSNAISLAPINTVAPTISGTNQVGSTLSSSTGTWSGSPSSYAYQWQRAGANIAGATSSTYLVVGADAGNALTCNVVAIANGQSSALVSSSNSITIAAYNSAPPIITGTFAVGNTLSTTNGTWQGATSFTYQWQSGGVNIAGATGSTYVIQSSDAGNFIVVIVSGSGPGGSTSTTSAPVGVLKAPKNLAIV